jgi:hypothetical protein
MTDVPAKEAEVRPVVTLRQAIAFYDALPEKTRKRFSELTESDLFERHHGFGMMLRNALLWHSDTKLLWAQLTFVKQQVEQGRSSLTYTQIDKAVEQTRAEWFARHTDSVSSALMDVLRLREDGKLELLELN